MAADALYHERIVELARSKAGAGKLAAPDASARRDNPLCGDRVTVDLRLDGAGRIVELAHQVRGCLLCQASAAALSAIAVGRDRAGIAALRGDLDAVLGLAAEAAEAAAAADFSVFAPVRAHRARHDCLHLPFDALDAAFVEAAGPR